MVRALRAIPWRARQNGRISFVDWAWIDLEAVDCFQVE